MFQLSLKICFFFLISFALITVNLINSRTLQVINSLQNVLPKVSKNKEAEFIAGTRYSEYFCRVNMNWDLEATNRSYLMNITFSYLKKTNNERRLEENNTNIIYSRANISENDINITVNYYSDLCNLNRSVRSDNLTSKEIFVDKQSNIRILDISYFKPVYTTMKGSFEKLHNSSFSNISYKYTLIDGKEKNNTSIIEIQRIHDLLNLRYSKFTENVTQNLNIIHEAIRDNNEIIYTYSFIRPNYYIIQFKIGEILGIKKLI
jgi:hypothetical protein